jgi:hypothetical protein
MGVGAEVAVLTVIIIPRAIANALMVLGKIVAEKIEPV